MNWEIYISILQTVKCENTLKQLDMALWSKNEQLRWKRNKDRCKSDWIHILSSSTGTGWAMYCSTGVWTVLLFLPHFNLDSTLTENASVIATSLPAKTGCVPLLYEETRGLGNRVCVKEWVGGRHSWMVKLLPGQPRSGRKAQTHKVSIKTRATYI